MIKEGSMDLFGMKEHDERHDGVERQLRRLIEQVAQLSIDLGVTRTELRRLALTVEGKVSEADVDPAIVSLNQGIKDARVKLAAAQEAAEENWAAVNDELSEAIDSLREELAESEG
jgi:ABC-type transporter Mla subunit MlaD